MPGWGCGNFKGTNDTLANLHMNVSLALAPLLAAPKINWPILAPVAWFAVVLISFFFFVIRPQRRRYAEQQTLLDGIKVGEKVVTTSGILGVVHSIEEDTIVVTIAAGVNVTFAKGAILDRREDIQ